MPKPLLVKFHPRDIIYTFLTAFLLFIAIKIIIFVTPLQESLLSYPNETFIAILLFLIQIIIIAIPLYLFTFRKHKAKLKDFGFRKIKTIKILKFIGKAYLFWIIISLAVTQIFTYIGQEIPGYQGQEPVIPAFGEGTLAILATFIVAVLIAPFIEEIFFRGFILQTLVHKFNSRWGSVITAGLFALFHFQPQGIIPIFLLGIIINWIFLRSRSIWPCIIFHALNNGMALLAEVYLF